MIGVYPSPYWFVDIAVHTHLELEEKNKKRKLECIKWNSTYWSELDLGLTVYYNLRVPPFGSTYKLTQVLLFILSLSLLL